MTWIFPQIAFIKRQILQIRAGGSAILIKKGRIVSERVLCLLFYCPAMLIVALIRIIRPFYLIRFGQLNGPRIGHFAGNTELYLCEQDSGINVPQQRYVDLFYAENPVCNHQLKVMWKRVLHVWPSWIIAPVIRIGRLIPGWKLHEVGENTQQDRDVHNLLDRIGPHLKFTEEEISRGETGLREIGIPQGAPFICLAIRDSAYLDARPGKDWSYHNYRDCNIQNYVLAAESLANLGYYVVRMGAIIRKPLCSNHLKVIDYASNGMRSDFMDIYLGSRCAFCLSCSTGIDAVPIMFRRPVVYADMVPVGYLATYVKNRVFICKKHWLISEQRWLSLREIFQLGVGFYIRTQDYESRGVRLVENTPEEIRDVATEIAERLAGTWKPHEDDEELQRRFWEIFPKNAVGAFNKRPLHGKIRARFGAAFLRNNREWLE